MSVLQYSLHSDNPFSEKEFWGRQNELTTISRYLLSEASRCCAIIGEDTFGKTMLLQSLSNAQEMLAREYPELGSFFLAITKEVYFCISRLCKLW